MLRSRAKAAARTESSMNTIALTELIDPRSRHSSVRSVVSRLRPQSSALTMRLPEVNAPPGAPRALENFDSLAKTISSRWLLLKRRSAAGTGAVCSYESIADDGHSTNFQEQGL